MNPFTIHTQQQGVSYIEHCCFALAIAYRLFSTVIAFSVHAIFPFIDIDPQLDLESTATYLQEQNNWIEHAKTRTAANGERERVVKQAFSFKQYLQKGRTYGWVFTLIVSLAFW